MGSDNLQQIFPWLFIDKFISIDILYDEADSDEDNERELSAGEDTIKTANELNKALTSLGHTARLFPVNEKNLEVTINNLQGDMVFNQVESDELGFKVLLALEKLNKPVTGVDSGGYIMSWDKAKVKEILLKANVPTPRYGILNPNKVPQLNLNYPLFVKAADDHGSLSISANSFVRNEEELAAQVQWVKETIGGDSLVEEYVDGRELNVTFLGNGKNFIVLPAKEIIFGKKFTNKPKIMTYEAKWKSQTEEYQETSAECPAKLSSDESKAIEEVVRLCSRALNARDYARFDIRLKDKTPYVIDYNPNPGLDPQYPSALSAEAFGLTYPEFIGAIVAVALKRYS